MVTQPEARARDARRCICQVLAAPACLGGLRRACLFVAGRVIRRAVTGVAPAALPAWWWCIVHARGACARRLAFAYHPRSHPQASNPLNAAELDLTLAYTLNSLFWGTCAVPVARAAAAAAAAAATTRRAAPALRTSC